MAKAEIYNGLFDTKTIVVKEFITHGERTYSVKMNRIVGNPDLFDKISLLLENFIKTNKIKFDRICAASTDAIPYATNVATSFEKAIGWVVDNGNDRMSKGNISNIRIEGDLEIDERVLLVETISSPDFYLENIITRIRKYGGQIAGILIILNTCEGEYVNLIAEKAPIHALLNLFDIFTYLENNNLIEMFYSEKVKFFCEKETKINLAKLLSPKQQETKYETSS